MPLVIDGYNLLYASGILGRGVGKGSLERSRNALLNFLAESLDERELPQTTVVFDANDPPKGLPRQIQYRGMTVRFADPGSDADAVIEDLIRAHSSPRKLIVVSSDHRLHRAARRRRAKPIDSDQWYAETLRQRIARVERKSPSLKPGDPSEIEVEFWLRKFGLDPSPATEPDRSPPPDSPFPPGYGEDLE